MKNKRASAVALASIAITAFVVIPSVHAEKGSENENRGPGNLRNVPQLKNFEKLATRSGDFIKKVEDKFSTRSGKLNELKELKEKFASRAGEFEHKFASLSGKLKEDRAKRLARLNETISQRFSKLTDRQENILKRANVRIASLSAEGKNVSDLNVKSASVSAMIAKQRASVAALKTTLEALTAANTSDGVKNVGNAVSDVVKQVGATQKALQNLISAIGKLTPHSPKPTHTASPSSSPNI